MINSFKLYCYRLLWPYKDQYTAHLRLIYEIDRFRVVRVVYSSYDKTQIVQSFVPFFNMLKRTLEMCRMWKQISLSNPQEHFGSCGICGLCDSLLLQIQIKAALTDWTSYDIFHIVTTILTVQIVAYNYNIPMIARILPSNY